MKIDEKNWMSYPITQSELKDFLAPSKKNKLFLEYSFPFLSDEENDLIL